MYSRPRRNWNPRIFAFFAFGFLPFSITEVYAWSSDPVSNELMCLDHIQTLYQTISNGSGGTLTVWYGPDSWIELVNGHGKKVWAKRSVIDTFGAFRPVISDDAGGLMLGSLSGVDLVSMSVARVDADGAKKWLRSIGGEFALPGQLLRTSADMVSDKAGGVISTWVAPSGIRVQRLNSTASTLWGTNGVLLSTGSAEFAAPKVTFDGLGGAIVTWLEYSDTDVTLYAQHITGAGICQWNTGKVVLKPGMPDLNWTLAWLAAGAITTDGNGGAIIAWTNSQEFSPNTLFAQRINSSGELQWGDNGVVVTTSSAKSAPALLPDDTSGAIIAWNDFSTTSGGTFMQHLDAAGVARCDPSGIQLTSVPTELRMVKSVSGDVLFAWSAPGLRQTDIYAQKFSVDGERRWDVGGITISSAPGDQINPQIVAEAGDQATFTWEDYRSLSQRGIYAARVDANGNQINDQADLVIQNSFSNPEVTLGDRVEFDIDVTNQGPEYAYGTSVTTELPATCRFISATSSQGTCTNSGSTVVCDIGALESLERVHIEILADSVTTGSLSYEPNVTSDVPDPNLLNNYSFATGLIHDPPYGICPAGRLNFVVPVATKYKSKSQGGKYTVSAKALVSAAGEEATSSTAVCFYLSDDANFDSAADTLIQQRRVKAASPGKPRLVKLRLSLEETDLSGKYVIAVMGNTDSFVSRCDRESRIAISGPVGGQP